MRQEFKVVVAGADKRALAALTNASIKAAGPAESMPNRLEAWVTADSAAEAQAFVEKNLPSDGGYVIEEVTPRDNG